MQCCDPVAPLARNTLQDKLYSSCLHWLEEGMYMSHRNQLYVDVEVESICWLLFQLKVQFTWVWKKKCVYGCGYEMYVIGNSYI